MALRVSVRREKRSFCFLIYADLFCHGNMITAWHHHICGGTSLLVKSDVEFSKYRRAMINYKKKWGREVKAGLIDLPLVVLYASQHISYLFFVIKIIQGSGTASAKVFVRVTQKNSRSFKN